MITKRRVIDLVERVVLTFVGAFIAVYLVAFASGDADIAFLKDPNLFNKAGTAGIAAIVPLVSGLIGFRVGDKQSASVVPSNKSEPEEPEYQYTYVDNPDDELGDH
jgi:hypothetical protein